MLKSVIRTPQQTAQYLCELQQSLIEARTQPAEEMADFFANRIDLYEDVHLGHWAEEYAHIADYLDDSINSLLDIGCGTGLELDAVFQRFPAIQVTGIDLSCVMLSKLKEKYSQHSLHLIEADYFQYPFAPSDYDAALSVETLHHFPYEKKQQIYHKLFHTLKAGGSYLECDYYACCDEEEKLCMSEYAYRRQKAGIAADTYIHIDIPLTLTHQVELMLNAGFSSVQVLYMNQGTVIVKATKPEVCNHR